MGRNRSGAVRRPRPLLWERTPPAIGPKPIDLASPDVAAAGSSPHSDVTNSQTGETSDPDADHGVKTYCGVNADGKAWKKIVHWFGETLKYRCPAAAYGFVCAGRAQCAALSCGCPGDFGRIVRVDLAQDYRIFIPTPATLRASSAPTTSLAPNANQQPLRRPPDPPTALTR